MVESEEQKARPRFSLQSLLAALTVAAMGLALFTQHRNNRHLSERNERFSKENRRLRDEVGELSIDDESRLHAIRTAAGEELRWAWRVWIPAGHEYKLRCAGGRIPSEGWPSSGGTMWLRESGEQVIQYRIIRDPRDDRWYGSLATSSGSVGKHRHDWVAWDSTTSSTGGVHGTTRVYAGDFEPIEICRHRISQASSTSDIEDPAHGFLVWIERVK